MFKLVVLLCCFVAIAMGNIPRYAGSGYSTGYGDQTEVSYPARSVPDHGRYHYRNGHYGGSAGLSQQSPWNGYNQDAYPIAGNSWANQGYNNYRGHHGRNQHPGRHGYNGYPRHQGGYNYQPANYQQNYANVGWNNGYGSYPGAQQGYDSYGYGSGY